MPTSRRGGLRSMIVPLHQDLIPAQRSATRYFIYLAGFVLFFWYTVLPIVGSDLSRIPGDLGDRVSIYTSSNIRISIFPARKVPSGPRGSSIRTKTWWLTPTT